MPSRIWADTDTGILEVRSFGEVTLDDLRSQIAEITRLAAETGIRKVLVDTLGEESLPSTFDFFDFMSNLPTDLVYAMYSNRTQQTHADMEFGETVALNRGIRIRHFSDRDSALSWILDQNP